VLCNLIRAYIIYTKRTYLQWNLTYRQRRSPCCYGTAVYAVAAWKQSWWWMTNQSGELRVHYSPTLIHRHLLCLYALIKANWFTYFLLYSLCFIVITAQSKVKTLQNSRSSCYSAISEVIFIFSDQVLSTVKTSANATSLQSTLDRLQQWCANWQLAINTQSFIVALLTAKYNIPWMAAL